MKQEGILVGFNFVGFLFVITKVIPRESFHTLEQLQETLESEKIQIFKWYCEADPVILGVYEY